MVLHVSSTHPDASGAAVIGGSFTLAEALALPLSPHAHADVLTVSNGIPRPIQGLFRLELRDGALDALQIIPDATSDALNRLLAAIGESHRYYQHGERPDIRYQGAELQALLDTTPHSTLQEAAPVTADIIRRGYDAHRSYAHDGMTFLDSYRLCDAAQLRQLPAREKQFLARVQRVIGDDLSGAFAFNLIERDGKPTIDSLFIAPNVVGRQLMDDILAPVDRSPGKARSFRSVGMREHWGGYTIEQPQIEALKALGDTLGGSYRRRA